MIPAAESDAPAGPFSCGHEHCTVIERRFRYISLEVSRNLYKLGNVASTVLYCGASCCTEAEIRPVLSIHLITVSELMRAHANIKHDYEKHFKEMALMDSHASLFHMIHSVVKSWRKTAKNDNTLLVSQKSDQIYLGMPQDAVSEKKLGTTIDTQEDKDICKPVHSKHLSASKSKSVILGKQQKHLGDLSPACMLPYLALISRCIPLPISDIESRCLKGQILCRIQYFTLRRSKKKLLPQPAPAKLPIPKLETTQAKYITFDGLKDLQWKLYKGLVKRKPKVTGTWREPCFTTGLIAPLTASSVEYILPLIPKDWIIDDSLQYTVPPMPISGLFEPSTCSM